MAFFDVKSCRYISLFVQPWKTVMSSQRPSSERLDGGNVLRIAAFAEQQRIFGRIAAQGVIENL